jgi:hypothetical protein
VNALRSIHAVLVPGGLVIDTQPVSPLPPIEAGGGELARLDMREWARTIALIDHRLAETIRDGLFALEDERRLVVTDAYDDGAELVAVVRDWAGTRIDAETARRVAAERGPVRIHQDVRLRLLRRQSRV